MKEARKSQYRQEIDWIKLINFNGYLAIIVKFRNKLIDRKQIEYD